jgi:hypothetical protein
MTIEPTSASAGLIDRIKNILLTPKAEWDRIAGEPVDVGKLYMGYVLPLAALSAVCAFVGMSVVGIMGFRIGLVPGLIGAAIQVAMALVGVFVLAFVTNALAPTFGSQQNMGQAHKLAVYGSTAGFLAGVFTIFPPLAVLGIVGLYSLALIYIGLPRLMKTPEDKRIGYFATIIVVCIVVGIVLSVVMTSVRGLVPGYGAPGYTFGQAAAPSQQASVQGQVPLPGGGSLDLSELEKMGQVYAQGGGAAVDPARLEAQLPQSLPGGFALTSVSNSSAMGTAQAEAVYQSGEARLTVTVVHMGAMGAVAAMAAAANVSENRRDADGYTRTNTVDGRVFTEEMSTSSGSAKYGVIGHGVAVTAEGRGGVTVDQARAAVETIGVRRLEQEFAS